MSLMGLGCAKTKSDLVVMPSGRQIFAFLSASPQSPKFGVRLYRLEFSHSQGQSLPSHSALVQVNVCFSNRPFGVKRFQTIHHHCSVDVTHGLVLLFGIGTKALVWGFFSQEV